jgi:DNA repair exonuclease SbcCD ATPase subunit
MPSTTQIVEKLPKHDPFDRDQEEFTDSSTRSADTLASSLDSSGDDSHDTHSRIQSDFADMKAVACSERFGYVVADTHGVVRGRELALSMLQDDYLDHISWLASKWREEQVKHEKLRQWVLETSNTSCFKAAALESAVESREDVRDINDVSDHGFCSGDDDSCFIIDDHSVLDEIQERYSFHVTRLKLETEVKASQIADIQRGNASLRLKNQQLENLNSDLLTTVREQQEREAKMREDHAREQESLRSEIRSKSAELERSLDGIDEMIAHHLDTSSALEKANQALQRQLEGAQQQIAKMTVENSQLVAKNGELRQVRSRLMQKLNARCSSLAKARVVEERLSI